jgi:diaminopropionate ammonia-lyase
MFLSNRDGDYGRPLNPVDAETLGIEAAGAVERYLSNQANHVPTPLHSLPALADELDVGVIHVKDEGYRLGLGSFKALGSSYAVPEFGHERDTTLHLLRRSPCLSIWIDSNGK